MFGNEKTGKARGFPVSLTNNAELTMNQAPLTL